MTNNKQGNFHKVYQPVYQQKLYKPEGEWHTILKWWKGKTYNQECFTQQDSHWDLTEKSQKLSRQTRELSTIKPVLQQMLKELL